MKHALIAIAILAVANLVAILGFAGWLKASDRLDGARIEKVRQIFAPTIGRQKQVDEEAAASSVAQHKAAEVAGRLSRPAITSEMELSARIQTTELDRQRQQRLRDEIGQLQTTIGAKLDELEALKAQVAQARLEFESLTQKTRELASDQQFKKSLGVLEAMKPGQARAALQEVMVAPAGKEKAVAYLNAMDEGIRAKVMQEFLKAEPKVAADLLEALRTSGVPPVTPGAAAK